MPVPHPIPYQGSKRYLAPRILQYFPADVRRLVEPFAGSAALSLGAAQSGKTRQFWLNDINAPLIDLWRSILYTPDALANRYALLWTAQLGQERAYYDLVRARFNLTQRPYYLLYLLARCVKAAVRYNAAGEFNQSPDNRRKGRQPESMRQDILAASALLRDGTMLTAEDYRAVLPRTTPNDLVYLDLPYQGVCATRDPRYFKGIDEDQFVCALADLNMRGIPYLLSYDGKTGKTGSKQYGKALPSSLQLEWVELDAGRSSQATLLGRDDRTVESLYLSPALLEKLAIKHSQIVDAKPTNYCYLRNWHDRASSSSRIHRVSSNTQRQTFARCC